MKFIFWIKIKLKPVRFHWLFPCFFRLFLTTFWCYYIEHTPVYCSAIKCRILIAKFREHQRAPLRHSFERQLICGGNLSHKQPRGDFNIYSAVCSAYVSFGKQLTLAHYTQMKADLQTGQRPHSLCGEVSPSYEAMALFFSLPLLCLCILNSIRGPVQTRGPRLTWCILYVNMVLMYFKMQTRL